MRKKSNKIQRKIPMKRKKRLRSRSRNPKKVAQDKLYKKLRIEFLTDHPQCQFVKDGVRCNQQATDIHHKAGRLQFHNRVDTWMCVCREHHTYIHEDGVWSAQQGYTINPIILLKHEERIKNGLDNPSGEEPEEQD